MKDENTKTILLTGRTEPFRALFEEIFSIAGLLFDQIILRPDSEVSTDSYKSRSIENLLSFFSTEDVLEISIWDDHKANTIAMRSFLETEEKINEKLQCFHIHLVPSRNSSLDDKKQEKIIVRNLLHQIPLSKGKAPLQIIPVVQSTGIELEEDSKKKIREFLGSRSDSHTNWHFYPLDILINKGPSNLFASKSRNASVPKQGKGNGKGKKRGKKNEIVASIVPCTDFPDDPYALGDVVLCNIVSFYEDDKVLAVGVEGVNRILECKDTKPHILIASSKKHHTITTLTWETIPKSEYIKIRGRVKEFTKYHWK